MGIAAMSEPWGEDVARDAMELFTHERSHIVLVGWFRAMMSDGRGKSCVLELQKAFLMDGRYRLEDVTGELNFDSVGVFRLREGERRADLDSPPRRQREVGRGSCASSRPTWQPAVAGCHGVRRYGPSEIRSQPAVADPRSRAATGTRDRE